jgi:hypothetical protein
MPGSLTTRSQTASRDGETARVAFGVRHTLGAPDGITIAAQWLAYAHPYRRFASVLADRRARLGADVGRYSFIAEDLHLLSPTGLPAHAWIIHEAEVSRLQPFASQGSSRFSCIKPSASMCSSGNQRLSAA